MSALLYLRTQLIFSLIKHSFGGWGAGSRLFPEAPCVEAGVFVLLVPRISADACFSRSRREEASASALAGAQGVPCVMRPRGFGGDAGNDRWPVPAVALTAERVGAHCVREIWCRKSSLVRHTSGSRSSFCSEEFPWKCSAQPVHACASGVNCRDVSALKTMSVTQVCSIVPPVSGEVDLSLWPVNNIEGTRWRQLTPQPRAPCSQCPRLLTRPRFIPLPFYLSQMLIECCFTVHGLGAWH